MIMNKQEASLKVRDIIVAARKSMGLSRYQFAKLLGTKQTNVTCWEEGSVSPRSDYFFLIMELKKEHDRNKIQERKNQSEVQAGV